MLLTVSVQVDTEVHIVEYEQCIQEFYELPVESIWLSEASDPTLDAKELIIILRSDLKILRHLIYKAQRKEARQEMDDRGKHLMYEKIFDYFPCCGRGGDYQQLKSEEYREIYMQRKTHLYVARWDKRLEECEKTLQDCKKYLKNEAKL